MEHLKDFLKELLITAFALQIGNIILYKTKFYNNYKRISGVIMAICLISGFISFDISFDNIDITYNDTNLPANDIIKSEFQNNLKEIIENDIHNIYYVNLNIDIETNYNKLVIAVNGKIPKTKENEIKEYIKNKYCTPNDEVIIHNEDT